VLQQVDKQVDKPPLEPNQVSAKTDTLLLTMPLPTLRATLDVELNELNKLNEPLAKHEAKDRSNPPTTPRSHLNEPTILNVPTRSNRLNKPS
jgi:hypothetical protein